MDELLVVERQGIRHAFEASATVGTNRGSGEEVLFLLAVLIFRVDGVLNLDRREFEIRVSLRLVEIFDGLVVGHDGPCVIARFTA